MSKLTTTVELMDARLMFITDKRNELSDRQGKVEESVQLLHESVL